MSSVFPLIEIPNAKFIFQTNFKGLEKMYNNEGERNFNVILDGEPLKNVEECGIPVKYTKPDADGNSVAYIKVNVGYKHRPPIAQLINSRCKRNLNEKNIGVLDDYEYSYVDLVIRPNRWHSPDGSRTGVNAYLAEIYATVKESSFAAKYWDVPEENSEYDDDMPF